MQETLGSKTSQKSALWLSIASILVLTILTSPVGAEYKGKYPYKIGTTIGMIADIIKQVAGDKAEVTNIIGTGVDPHLFNPTRSDVAVCLKIGG